MKRMSPHIDELVGLDLPVGVANAPLRQSMSLSEGGTGAPGGYNAGRRDRRALRNWRPKAGSANADTLLDLVDLRARSREAERNIPIAAGAISTTTTNVIGDGLQLQSSIDAAALGLAPEVADRLEREQEREWALFCRSVDFTGVQCFDEQQELAFRSALQSGDVIAIRRFRRDPGDAYGTKLQLIEADRLCNPDYGADSETLSGGVEVDADGRPVRYHIARKHPGGLRVGGNSWESIPARDDQGRRLVIHVFDRTRPELTRGVPYLGPVIEHLKQLGNYADAEVTAAVIGAMITMVVTTPTEEGDDPIVGTRGDPNLADNEVKLGSGATVSLNPGEKAELLNPSRPNVNFDPFVQAFLRQVGVALELPFELLIKHFTASYSASKAALEMARMFFRKRRSRFAWRVCQEVYGWMMDEAVASGRLNRPGYFADPVIREAWLGATWIGPSMPSLNPKQEAEADEIDVRLGVKTREQICMERTGGEVEKKTEQLAREEKARKAAGLQQAAPPAAQPGEPARENSDEEAA
jgi:lambda family phage portal protein